LIPAIYKKVVVSNQSGAARGYFGVNDVEKFNAAMLADLSGRGINLDAIYYCPHGPDDGCDCRKPEIGQFKMAQERFKIDFSRSWMIGDKSSDIMAGKNIGAKTILVMTGYSGKEPGAVSIEPDYTANDLFEAVEIIRR